MNERFEKIVRHPATIPAVVGVLAFGSGVGVGYILGRRSIAEPVNDLPEQLSLDFNAKKAALEESERFVIDFDQLVDDSSPDPEEESVEDVVVDDVVVFEKIVPNPEDSFVRTNIFAGDDDNWNYDEELKNRTDKAPYVIHRDEFYSEESGYSQVTLTYYELDDILCDDANAPIYNGRIVVGDWQFGHGSGDPNVFYVRNESRQAEYEIIKDRGSYSQEVLGVEWEEQAEAELKHSMPRKLRDD